MQRACARTREARGKERGQRVQALEDSESAGARGGGVRGGPRRLADTWSGGTTETSVCKDPSLIAETEPE